LSLLKKNCMIAAKFLRNTSASTALAFAISMPALMGAAGIAVDFSVFNLKYTKLQAAADQAAIAAARELAVANSSSASVAQAAEVFARSILPGSNISVEVGPGEGKDTVKVTITEKWTPFFAHFIGANVTPVVTHATAGLYGEAKICVLALTPAEAGAVSMTKSAHLQAEGCTIYSNSSSSSSVYLGDVSSIEAQLVCTVGGVKDNGSLTANKIVTDCPVLTDPLAARPRLPVGMCDQVNLAIKTGTQTLMPGVYCGGIKISGDAVVNLSAGEYIIKDGPLLVYEKAQLRGNNVGFFMTGPLGLMHFMNEATIDLNGRQSGPMAGMLFFDDPLEKGMLRIHSISASKAFNLTGTIYLPNGNLIVDPAATVGAKSAYTAIVAKRLVVQNGPTLVLNTNYGDTPVPVPDGIKAAADVRLVE
jgi:Flp pilus assembly protein TadG